METGLIAQLLPAATGLLAGLGPLVGALIWGVIVGIAYRAGGLLPALMVGAVTPFVWLGLDLPLIMLLPCAVSAFAVAVWRSGEQPVVAG